jgi:hypothetical protein
MYNTHINHSSKATVFPLLKRHNQLWNSVTVASSGLFKLKDTMYRAKALVFHRLSCVVNARGQGPRRRGNKRKAMTPLTTLTPCWEQKWSQASLALPGTLMRRSGALAQKGNDWRPILSTTFPE